MSADSPPPAGLWPTAKAFGSLVRLSHTVFGMPFALASAALAHRFAVERGDPGLDGWRMLLIVIAFTGARSAAMGFNRIVDRKFDALNPRTADRELPRGVMSVRTAGWLTALSGLAFVLAAWGLGPVPAALAPLCLAIVFAYSFFKRFSWTSHLALGVALSLAPGGAWIAVTGGFDGWTIPLLLMAAVGTWVAGFDVLYALADADFDRAHGLHSIPARFGIVGSLWISGGLHVVSTAALATLHHHAGLGGWHLVGLFGVVVILLYEHAIVRPSDLRRLDKAFFDLNGYVSLVYLACTVLDVWRT